MSTGPEDDTPPAWKPTPKPDVPRPQWTEPPPQPDLQHTPAHGVVLVPLMQRKLGEMTQAFETLLKKHDNKLTLRSIIVAVGAVAASVIAVLIFIDNRVQAQTDAGVKVHEQRITTLEQQRRNDKEELDARLKRIEDNANEDHELTLGTSKKVDKLLERFSVPNPAPTPKDGGR